jgi:putative Holliday junction resolvase
VAVDVGRARIGLAISDYHGILASPLATIKRTDPLEACIFSLLSEIAEQGDVLEFYVGLPLNLRGDVTESTTDALNFAMELEEVAEAPVRLVDERLTTAIANQQLLSVGKSQREGRPTIDQMAAVAILEYALTVEKNSHSAPGVSISTWRKTHE